MAMLAKRAVASADLDDLHGLIVPLMSALPDAEMLDADLSVQVNGLLARIPAEHIDLSDAFTVGLLLETLRKVSADAQVSALLERDIGGQADLTQPGAVAYLLTKLQEAGADTQVTALLARDPIDAADPSDPLELLELLDAMGQTGTESQMSVVLDRLPGAGAFDIFLKHSGNAEVFRFGRGHDRRPAAPWGWDDLE
jgi:hypothetical protein